jgi:hypothetical protein
MHGSRYQLMAGKIAADSRQQAERIYDNRPNGTNRKKQMLQTPGLLEHHILRP